MTPTTSMGERIAALAGRIDQVLGDLVEPGEPVALIDFPSYPNVGDSAIWQGELAWLKRNGSEVVYVASHRDYNPAVARRRIARATILLSGGGNLGDHYPWHERLRTRVIEDFRGNRIVQLPQSSVFTSDDGMRRARGAFSRHPDLTILARDERTLEIASERLGVRAALCPDMAFCLGALRRPGPARHELLAVLRSDEHSVLAGEGVPEGVPVADWIRDRGPRRGAALMRALKPVEVATGYLGRLALPLTPLLAAAYRRYSAARLRAGLEVLSAGEVVITDRLHAVILCVLLGIPHVMFDEATGKLSGFHAAWLEGLEGCLAVDGLPEATAVAARLRVGTRTGADQPAGGWA